MVNGTLVKVVGPSETDEDLTECDKEMDYRARKAVEAAINKAKVCKKPIARYDAATGTAYLEYPDGEKKYAE